MSFLNSQTLTQARQTLVASEQAKQTLVVQVNEQSRKIADLEREVQRYGSALTQTRQALANARVEIEALRSQIPDEATVRAFNDLTQYLSNAAEAQPELRIAA